MSTENQVPEHRIPEPLDPPVEGSLPHALVFFLSREQRRVVLRALRAIDKSRETALLRAIGVCGQ